MVKKELKIKKNGFIETIKVIETPGRGKLNLRDFLIGLGMVVATPIVIQLWDILMAFLDYKPVTIDWRGLVKSGLGAGAAYIGKNLWDKSKLVIDSKDLK